MTALEGNCQNIMTSLSRGLSFHQESIRQTPDKRHKNPCEYCRNSPMRSINSPCFSVKIIHLFTDSCDFPPSREAEIGSVEHTNLKNTTTLIFEKGVNAPVNVLNTQALVDHEIKDFSENTHTHYFGCRGRTSSQWHRNSADRDPFVPVDTFDHDTASTLTVVLVAAIPEAFHRFPRLCIIASVTNNFPMSFCPPPWWSSDQLPDCVSEKRA